jgi:tetratricopeptide (TPR) repeat protein
MTIEMCPFVSKNYKDKTCPGCGVPVKWARGHSHEDIVNKCLGDISDDLKVQSETGDFQKIMSINLYKLKKVTAIEEDHPLDVLFAKKKSQKIYSFIEQRYKPADEDAREQFLLDLGDVLFNLGDYEDAEKHYILANKMKPEDKRTWNNLGVILVRLGKTKEAISYYDRALELDPKFGGAWFNKGKALFKLGMEKKALECFKNATKYSPKNKSAWNNLGVTLRHMRKFKESIKCYDQALKIHSDYPWAWHNKGVALMDLRRYKDAMRCFDRALRIDPDYQPAQERKREVLRHLLK